MRLAPIDSENFRTLPVYARLSTYWELDPATAKDLTSGEREFEKEAWVATVGNCGFTLGPPPSSTATPTWRPGRCAWTRPPSPATHSW